MGNTVKYAVGAFIQALGQNPGLEPLLKELGPQAHIYVGTGLGDFPLQYEHATALSPRPDEGGIVSGARTSTTVSFENIVLPMVVKRNEIRERAGRATGPLGSRSLE